MSIESRVEELILSDEWERRLPAIEESRTRVLNEYQMFPALARAIHRYGSESREHNPVRVPGYRLARWKHRTRYVAAMLRKGGAYELLAVAMDKLRYIRGMNLERPDV